MGAKYNLTCHSFVTNGMIQLLADCTFNANQNLEIQEQVWQNE